MQTFLEILKAGNEGYSFRDIINNLTDEEILADVETYAAQFKPVNAIDVSTKDSNFNPDFNFPSGFRMDIMPYNVSTKERGVGLLFVHPDDFPALKVAIEKIQK